MLAAIASIVLISLTSITMVQADSYTHIHTDPHASVSVYVLESQVCQRANCNELADLESYDNSNPFIWNYQNGIELYRHQQGITIMVDPERIEQKPFAKFIIIESSLPPHQHHTQFIQNWNVDSSCKIVSLAVSHAHLIPQLAEYLAHNCNDDYSPQIFPVQTPAPVKKEIVHSPALEYREWLEWAMTQTKEFQIR